MSWLDLLPSSERARIRKRLRSPEVYAKSREGIPSVEQIEHEMDKNEQLAELAMALELEPKLKEELKKEIEKDLQQLGPAGLLYAPDGVSEALQNQLAQGFDVSVDTNPDNDKDQLVLNPEGNVSEKLPMKFSLSDKYVQQFVQAVGEDV